MKTSSKRAIKTTLRSSQRPLKHIKILTRSNYSFVERWALQVAHFCWERDITEINSATPHIDRISRFKVYRIYQETLLQYFPNTWNPAPCSDISRCRNSAPKSTNGANFPKLLFFRSYHHFRVGSEQLWT